MKVLSAIGRFFARIGRWIKETAWIQPLLIVGAIFAIIFAIPHIISGVKGWFSSSDDTSAFFARYTYSLTGADKNQSGSEIGSSKVDKFFTYLQDGEKEEVVNMTGSERFFVAFVQKGNTGTKELCEGLKVFRDKWAANDAEFAGLKGKFKLVTIYTDTVNDDDENLFDMVWKCHPAFFETLTESNYLPLTPYAINEKLTTFYDKNFAASENEEKCPMSTPLMMYFDYTEDNWFDVEDQRILGLSDVLFSVEGSNKLEKARTLKRCWSHTKEFAEIQN